jgi:hypothetical protein
MPPLQSSESTRTPATFERERESERVREWESERVRA